jgi:hypothetical protein
MSQLTRVLVGDTFKQTFVNSGVTASPIVASILSGSETIVNSAAATSSGNGHYYNMVQINTPGYYVSQWIATISGNEYKRRQRFKAVLNEVD